MIISPSPLRLSSDFQALESNILRVVHRRGQRDAEEGASSAATLVAREILQEAAERAAGPLGEVLGGEARWRPPGE